MNTERALQLAMKYHSGVTRKESMNGFDPLPYISHPAEVMKLCWNWGCGSPLVLAAAALHDTLEDTDISESEIVICSGGDVLRVVKELTFIPPAGANRQEAAMLKEEYLESFARSSIEALVIKVADRMCNVMDFYMTDRQYALKYFNKAAPLYQHMFFRHEEIAKVFGKDAEYKIMSTHGNVKRCVEAKADAGSTGVSTWL
jgi:(p)ppGpp synthase/HD superfamily hydrolase